MDNVWLTNAGTTINIGSWIVIDPGPDWGARDILQYVYAQNPLTPGGRYAYDFAPVRRMRFPLLVGSQTTVGSLDKVEAMLRLLARPGATIDIKPDGVATAEMVRFDVVGGRVNHDPYSLPIQRIARRKLALELDTQPFGYWPTWIMLASVSALSLPAYVAINGAASVIGDAPAPVRLILRPSAPEIPSSALATVMTRIVDGIAWSVGAGASVPTMIPGGSMINPGISAWKATYRADSYASGIGGPTVVDTFVPPAVGTFFGGAALSAANLLYLFAKTPVGRFRVYAWMQLGPSGALPVQVSAGAMFTTSAPLPSANPIASVAPMLASTGFFNANGAVSAYGNISPSVYSLYDLGEISLPADPAIGSALATSSGFNSYVGLWFKPASAAATQTLSVAGIYLHAVDGPNGIIPRGLGIPTITQAAGVGQGLMLDTTARAAALGANGAGMDFSSVRGNAWPFYRGQMPYVSGSTTFLSLLPFPRQSNASGAADPVIWDANPVTLLNLAYRPTFAFLRGF